MGCVFPSGGSVRFGACRMIVGSEVAADQKALCAVIVGSLETHWFRLWPGKTIA